MFEDSIKVLQKGDERGNNMAILIHLPSGVKIFALGTANHYGGDWDLGPTWNYIVCSENTFMVDSGNIGTGMKLLGLMEHVGLSASDLKFILLSHGHEDHDGGLAEIARHVPVEIRAHEIYHSLIRFYPARTPARAIQGFPASCWHCPMPKAFSDKHCVQYHEERSGLRITQIQGANSTIDGMTQVHHVPGHSPDSLAIRIGEEAVLVGDTVLPGITPHPSMEGTHGLTAGILPPGYGEENAIYGLKTNLASLKKLQQLAGDHPNMIVLPGHRLFYKSTWNWISLDQRIDELMDHHVQRCGDILEILREGPKSAQEIAHEYFNESLLKGYGILLAVNEILSHLELLAFSGDVAPQDSSTFLATGSGNIESVINGIEALH